MNNEYFFIIVDTALICWDYQNHKQYELTAEHAHRLITLIYNPENTEDNNSIDQDLLRCGIIKSHPNTDPIWGWDILSRIFHFGTKNIPLDVQPKDQGDWATQYYEHCQDVWLKEPPAPNRYPDALKLVPLSRQADLSPFENLLKKRSTSRDFFDLPVQLEALTRILEHSLAFIDERELPEASNLPEAFRKRRSSPSGGGLNSTEAYIYIRNVEHLDAGIYHYDPFEHCLRLLPSELTPLGVLLSGQHFADNIPAGVFLTSRLDKLWWKYEHSRAYRIALLETGHFAQTLQLMATSLGLDTWLTGALCEQHVGTLLNLENPAEQVLFFVGFGHASKNAIPESLQAILG